MASSTASSSSAAAMRSWSRSSSSIPLPAKKGWTLPSQRPAPGRRGIASTSSSSSSPDPTTSWSGTASDAGAAHSRPEDEERTARRQRRTMLDMLESMGSSQTRQSAYQPYQSRLDPLTAKELTLAHLLAATAQMGHSLGSLARAHQANIYGVRHKLAIIDVEKATLPALRRAAAVVRAITERDGVILFLGTRPGQQAAIIAAAKRLGSNGYHVTTDRWLPGSITNAPMLLSGAVSHAISSSPALQEATGSNQDEPATELSGDNEDGDGVQTISSVKLAARTLQPDLLIVLNPLENMHAIREATQANIPTMAITDTDVDPRAVTYAIPANDDALRTVELVVGVLSKAGEQGLRDRRRKREEREKAMATRSWGAGRRGGVVGRGEEEGEESMSTSTPSASRTAARRAATGPHNEYTSARDAEDVLDKAQAQAGAGGAAESGAASSGVGDALSSSSSSSSSPPGSR